MEIGIHKWPLSVIKMMQTCVCVCVRICVYVYTVYIYMCSTVHMCTCSTVVFAVS